MGKTPLLNEFLSTGTILHQLGANVKSLPTIISYPNEKNLKLCLHPDGNGIWGVCWENGFVGDGIDVLKHFFGVQSLEQVLWKMEETGCIADRREIPDAAIHDYELERSRRLAFMEFWKECNERIKNSAIDSELPMILGIKADPKRWVNGFAQFVGSASRRDIENELGTKIRTRASQLLIAPYYDMPGRISVLRLIFKERQKPEYMDRYFDRRGGLFMLEAVPPNTEFAIAIEDTFLALRRQYEYAFRSEKPLPLLVYHPETTYWPVMASRLIFWDKTYTVNMFIQARLNPNSAVSVPRTSVNHDMLDVEPWVQHVIADARRWPIALKDWLLNIDPEQARLVISKLGLTSDERGELFYECDTGEKQVLKDLVEQGQVVKHSMVGDRKIFEREDSWFAMTHENRMQRISNATFSIDKSMDYGVQGIFLSGVIKYNKKEYRFQAPVDEFIRNPAAWLRSWMLKKNIGLLQTARAWERSLLEISYGFSGEKIEHSTCSPRVGWTDDRTKFKFPNVTLCEGVVDEEEPGIPGDQLPCGKVSSQSMPADNKHVLCAVSDINRYFWAFFAGACANIVASFFNAKPVKFGVVGNSHLVEIFADALDLCTVQLSNKNASIIRKELNGLLMHAVPQVLFSDTNFKEIAKWLMGPTDKNVAVSMTEGQAYSVGGQSWQVLPIKMVEGFTDHLKSAANFLSTLVKKIQTSNPESVGNPAHTVLDLMMETLPEEDRVVLQEARLLLKAQTPSGPALMTDQFFFYVFSQMREGSFKVSKASRAAAHVILEDKQVILARSVFSQFWAANSASVERALEKGDYLVNATIAELVVSRILWDSAYENWLSKRVL